jgi:hypothetical protein
MFLALCGFFRFGMELKVEQENMKQKFAVWAMQYGMAPKNASISYIWDNRNMFGYKQFRTKN